jgi:uncharacterized membrane protein YoaK (UPF0700 family)
MTTVERLRGSSADVELRIAAMDDRRFRNVLLGALMTSSGAIDAASWLVLGKTFAAFMTGNLVYVGFRLGGAAGPSLPRAIVALAAFAIGTIVAARIVAPTKDAGWAWPRRVTFALVLTLVAEAALLAGWVGVNGHPGNRAGDALVALAALAMGAQTAAAFSLGLRATFTTAATATFMVFMGDLSGWSQSHRERVTLAADLVCLVVGAAVGGLLVVHAHSWAPAFSLVLTALVVAAAAIAARLGVFPGQRPYHRGPGS